MDTTPKPLVSIREKGVTMLELRVNGQIHTVDVPPDTPLLWVLRESLGLTGTKLGCGMAICGTCTVHLNGEPIRACITPVSVAVGKEVTTLERSVNDRVERLRRPRPAEKAQYGYC